jgi:hypothetical protein
VTVDIPGWSEQGVPSAQDGTFIVLNVPAGLQRFVARYVGSHDEAREILVRCVEGSVFPSVTFLMRERTWSW